MASQPAEIVVDDRLATVLATAPLGHSGARTQYRQLLDLLGRTPADFDLPLAARVRLEALEAELGADERAELVRALPGSLRHPGLILRLAAQAPVVAAAAIQSARLDDWQWSALALELPVHARGHLRHRRDLGPRARGILERLGILDLGLPSPEDEAVLDLGHAEVVDAADARPAPAEGSEEIAAIVRRIEAFRRTRQAATRQFDEAGAPQETAPRLPMREFAIAAAPPREIRFASAVGGRIVAADAPFAPMLAGLPLGRTDGPAAAKCDPATARAAAQRRPIRGGRMAIAGAPAIAGAWRIDAVPRFASDGGRFLGYSGVLRRPDAPPLQRELPADRLGQLLHELKTPVNAIQGFAELIQQQIFGPAPHQYRSLAASIASDSAAVLAGFEDIDRLVRFETGRGNDVAGKTDLAAVLGRLIGLLRPGAAARQVTFAFDPAGPVLVAMAEAELERTLWRVLALLASEACPGEAIALDLAARGESVELGIALPAAVAGRDDAALFAVEPAGGSPAPAFGLLGGGFALRLARAEAGAAGGALLRDGDRLVLRLPGLTPASDANSPITETRTG